MDYLWTKGVNMPKFPALRGDARTDVLIIGGGMAGILCALELKLRGVDFMLVEASNIGGGVTKGTTAVITAQHDTLYSDLIKKFGAQKAKMYLEANLCAVGEYAELCRKIDCDFERSPSIMYAQTDKEASLLEKEYGALKSLGFTAVPKRELTIPLDIRCALEYPSMARFHPLKFIAGVVSGMNIYENTMIKKLDGTTAYGDFGKIAAKRVIVASHFPFVNSHGLYFAKMYQKRSFVAALSGAPRMDYTAVGMSEGSLYFRGYGDLLIVGGADRRTGKSGGFDVLHEGIARLFPAAREVYLWATQDCISLDGVPYIGKYGKSTDGVYVVTGMNEWGMTTSLAAANILADAVTGRKNPFAAVFDPARAVSFLPLMSNLGATLANFCVPTVKRCPHLGCALKYNKAEHSWDCPCHGSRFTENGKLINNPALRSANVKQK